MIGIPNLKRIKISSAKELSSWLAKNDGQEESVMLVTSTKANPSKYVSREQVHEVLEKHGWTSTSRYTLNKTLIGHAVKKQ